MEKFDFIIIGAGSAGCVLANRIIKTGKYKGWIKTENIWGLIN